MKVICTCKSRMRHRAPPKNYYILKKNVEAFLGASVLSRIIFGQALLLRAVCAVPAALHLQCPLYGPERSLVVYVRALPRYDSLFPYLHSFNNAQMYRLDLTSGHLLSEIQNTPRRE
jgi:hypothetical protein